MQITSHHLQIATRGKGLYEITGQIAAWLESAQVRAGLLTVFVPHATAGLVVVELGAGSESDLMSSLDRLIPRDDRWVHRHGSPGHGADHLVSLLAPPSLTIPVVGGRLTLGTWQSIALVDPNQDNAVRTVRLAFLPG